MSSRSRCAAQNGEGPDLQLPGPPMGSQVTARAAVTAPGPSGLISRSCLACSAGSRVTASVYEVPALCLASCLMTSSGCAACLCEDTGTRGASAPRSGSPACTRLTSTWSCGARLGQNPVAGGWLLSVAELGRMGSLQGGPGYLCPLAWLSSAQQVLRSLCAAGILFTPKGAAVCCIYGKSSPWPHLAHTSGLSWSRGTLVWDWRAPGHRSWDYVCMPLGLSTPGCRPQCPGG